ncbi:SDR family oxidoreductase [Desulfopila inferna]|uniref:SDR family oxidoreductase n=1 Tax=Desulfopila inferna TaxID=468528 RepID=UPI001962E725|nr:SDR family oxidoreductase [Desulfopila inferna]
MKRVLITGSNRGIGLEFTRQYLESGWHVYATCRRPTEAQSLHMLLELHSRLTIHRLDITQQEDINSLCQELMEVPINILINNAGVYFRKRSVGIDCIHYDNWRRTFEVNTLGPVRITEALLGNIAESTTVRLIVVLSSHMERIAEINEGDSFYYRSSKSALNAAMQGISAEMKEQEIGVLLLHPGAVMTRIGPLKGISTRESVSGMRQIIEGFTMEQTGKFFSYDGEEIPW